MDGIAATIELRRRGVHMPIVGLTANSDDETLADASSAGMTDLLTKPVSLAALRECVDKYGRRPRLASQ